MIEHDVKDQARILIDQYNLHFRRGRPLEYVSLEPLEPLFPLVVRDLSDWGMDGCVIPPSGEITPSNPAVINVHKGLSKQRQRIIHAHEIGHALNDHAGAFKWEEAKMDLWFADREEREAWEVAAMLLVPIDTVVTYQDASRIATICDVPEWLVGLLTW